jgi:hypothetical protein
MKCHCDPARRAGEAIPLFNGDCFVASLLAMTLILKRPHHRLFSLIAKSAINGYFHFTPVYHFLLRPHETDCFRAVRDFYCSRRVRSNPSRRQSRASKLVDGHEAQQNSIDGLR